MSSLKNDVSLNGLVDDEEKELLPGADEDIYQGTAGQVLREEAPLRHHRLDWNMATADNRHRVR
jgi:hypothetical protein